MQTNAEKINVFHFGDKAQETIVLQEIQGDSEESLHQVTIHIHTSLLLRLDHGQSHYGTVKRSTFTPQNAYLKLEVEEIT
jgi:hypothetical protein